MKDGCEDVEIAAEDEEAEDAEDCEEMGEEENCDDDDPLVEESDCLHLCKLEGPFLQVHARLPHGVPWAFQ